MTMWSLSREAFSDRFGVEYEPSRAHEIACAQNEAAQSKAAFPVDVASFIAAEMPGRPLFHTVNHPSGAVLSMLLRGLATLLSSEMECAALVELADEWSTREGLNYLTDHPVAPEIRDSLGWEWGDTYTLYAEMLRLTVERRWRELEEHRDAYEPTFKGDTQFWCCMASLGNARRDDSIALPAFEQLLRLCPGVAGPWMMYARYLVALRRRDDAEALIERARVLGNSSAFHGIAADVFALLKNWKMSEMHARERLKRSPNEMRATFPLISILVKQGRNRELELLLASLAARPPRDRKLLDQYLARQRRLVQD